MVLTGARFFLTALLARRLTQDAFGQYGYIQWLIDLAFLICSLGVPGVAGRFVAEYRSQPLTLAAFMRSWWPFAIGLPMLSAAVALSASLLLGLPLSSFALAMVALWAFAGGAWTMQTAALIGAQRFDLVLLANLSAAVIMLSGAALLPLETGGVGLMFAVMAVATGSAALFGVRVTFGLTNPNSPGLAPAQWRTIRSYAGNIWLTAILWSLVWSRGELPIVRAHLGDSGVAAYTTALTLFGGAIQGVMLGVSGVLPELTRLFGEGREAEMTSLARRVMDLQLLPCAAAALGAICVGPELLTLAFGDRYSQSANALALLGVGLLSLVLSIHNHMLQIATNARYNRNTSLLGMAVLFAAALPLVARFGIDGAAAARAGTMLLLAGISLVTVAQRWGSRSVSSRNVLWLFLILVGVLLLVLSAGQRALWQRGGLLLLASAVLLIKLRDQEGALLGRSILRGISRRIVHRIHLRRG
jgi:O-antigen/teichoic acid export membrane protein